MTPLQREALEAYERHGTLRAAAEALGISKTSFEDRLTRARRYKDAPEGQRAAIDASGLDSVAAKHGWRVVQHEDGSRDSVFWKAEDAAPEDIAEKMREAFEGMSAAPLVTPPEQSQPELCTVYPLMDVHYGMQAWGRETGGDDYGLKEADADMAYAFSKVTAITPDSEVAILLIGGDFFHADDNRNETPAHRHKLDTDNRHWKVLQEGVRFVAAVIAILLGKHSKLIVRVMRGNHDEHSHLVLTFALAERHRDDERVIIEKTPRDLFMFEWGRAAIFAHHGDKVKPEALTLLLSDICPFWTNTRHRYAITGHVHHDRARDIGPLRWESLRAFCPPDAYAAGMGYAPRRALHSLTFDKQDGLVLRAIDPIERPRGNT